MATRVVEGKKPYTGGEAITVDEDKVISLNLRDENNLIIYDEGDDEIYVDLQLPNEIEPTDAFPIGVNTGRVIVDNGWDKTGTIISAKTTSGDEIKLLYADDGTLWIDNGTGTFKQIYFKSDVDGIITTLTTYINLELAKKQNGVSSDTAPTNPSEGDLWYDTVNDQLKVYDGSQWNATGSGGGDVVVSPDAGNELSTGVGLWLGTESDFSSIVSPDSNTMYIQYKSDGGGGRLPSAYQEVEYIRSSGSCAINTGFSPSGSYLGINLKMKFDSTSSASGNTPFVYGYVPSNFCFLCRNGDSPNYFEFGNGNSAKKTSTLVATGTDYTMEIVADNGTQTIDINGVTDTGSCGSSLTTGNIPIFCRYNNDYEYFATDMTLYYFQIYSSANTLERDLVPCYRIADSVIGMYDLVNDVFYTNVGSGTFIKGNDVN